MEQSQTHEKQNEKNEKKEQLIKCIRCDKERDISFYMRYNAMYQLCTYCEDDDRFKGYTFKEYKKLDNNQKLGLNICGGCRRYKEEKAFTRKDKVYTQCNKCNVKSTDYYIKHPDKLAARKKKSSEYYAKISAERERLREEEKKKFAIDRDIENAQKHALDMELKLVAGV